MHVTVDPAARNEIVIGIAAAQASPYGRLDLNDKVLIDQARHAWIHRRPYGLGWSGGR